MPLLKSKSQYNNLSDTAKGHYKSVKTDRTIKGSISIGLGVLLGLLVHFMNLRTTRLQKVCIILFVTFFSMNILYELMWQHKFIFEEKNVNTILEGDEDIEEDKEDIITYAKMYKKSRYAMNIIEVSSISISLVCTLILYFYLKK
tara:strand:- start:288 stop:722 length:435 start_codon:yes stop_codon:yes gene_type:complete